MYHGPTCPVADDVGELTREGLAVEAFAVSSLYQVPDATAAARRGPHEVDPAGGPGRRKPATPGDTSRGPDRPCSRWRAPSRSAPARCSGQCSAAPAAPRRGHRPGPACRAARRAPGLTTRTAPEARRRPLSGSEGARAAPPRWPWRRARRRRRSPRPRRPPSSRRPSRARRSPVAVPSRAVRCSIPSCPVSVPPSLAEPRPAAPATPRTERALSASPIPSMPRAPSRSSSADAAAPGSAATR